jgi:hypothetical protein
MMSNQDRERLPEELGEIGELLRCQRPEAGPLELDRIKLRAKAQASRRGPVLVSGKGNAFMRSRAVGLIMVVGLLGGGTGAMAWGGGPTFVSFPFHSFGHGNGASHSQYCPPSSWQPGKLKHSSPGGCGRHGGDDGVDDGADNGQGDDHGNGNGNGKGKGHWKSQSFGDGPGNGKGHGNGNGGGNGNGHGKGNGGGNGNGKSQAQGNGNGGGHGNAKGNGGGGGGGKGGHGKK